MAQPPSPPWRRLIADLAARVDRLQRRTTTADVATVVDTTAGAAEDGNTLCTVSWRGAEVDAAYLSTYTPNVGDDVSVLYQGGALLVIGKPIGKP